MKVSLPNIDHFLETTGYFKVTTLIILEYFVYSMKSTTISSFLLVQQFGEL